MTETEDGWDGPEELVPVDEQDADQQRSLVQCTHPNPPGFSPCFNKVTTCLTCKVKFKC